jgi:hypothetical protein
MKNITEEFPLETRGHGHFVERRFIWPKDTIPPQSQLMCYKLKEIINIWLLYLFLDVFLLLLILGFLICIMNVEINP